MVRPLVTLMCSGPRIAPRGGRVVTPSTCCHFIVHEIHRGALGVGEWPFVRYGEAAWRLACGHHL